MKLQIEPEDLLPKLPSPKDLQPFPSVLCVEYKGHKDMVRTMSTDPLGQYLLTGSDDGTVKIWEVQTGRCLRTVRMGDVVRSVEWNPNKNLGLVAVACGQKVILINPLVGDSLVGTKTDDVLKQEPVVDVVLSERLMATVKWEKRYDGGKWDNDDGLRIVLQHFKVRFVYFFFLFFFFVVFFRFL